MDVYHFAFSATDSASTIRIDAFDGDISIPQKKMVQRQFKLLIGSMNLLKNYQRTKRSCKKIFKAVQSLKKKKNEVLGQR